MGGSDVPPTPPLPPLPTQHGSIKRMTWAGEVPPQKYVNLYQKLMSPYVLEGGVTVRMSVEITPTGGVSPQRVEEAKAALRELGLEGDLEADE